MQTGLSLVDLATKIEKLNKAKLDMIVDTGATKMVVDGAPKLMVPSQGSYPIRPLAHGQLATHLGIPTAYYDRMLTKAPELLADNVNKWLGDKPERRMVRTLEGEMRAFLSDRYMRVDNYDIAKVALPILLNTPGLTVKSCEITERRMYIQAVSTKIEREVKGSKRVGDIVQCGVVISNSEVGFGAVAVAELDYFLACLNGMISSKLLRAAHVGRQVEDNAALWAQDTMAADDKAMVLKVRDMITAAMDEGRFEARVNKMSTLTDAKMGKNVAAAVEVLGQRIGATQEETGSIMQALIEGGDLSAWGVVNAVTAQAHNAAISYDRAVEFEAIGGQLLELSRDAWTEVLDAEKAPVRRGRRELVAA